MRTLKFKIEGQIIEQDPSCDFTKLVPGTSQHLRAEFVFSPEWKDYKKVAAFFSVMGVEYEPQMLTNGKSCIIPAAALKKRTFKIQIVGRKGDEIINTNKIAITQNGR